MTPLPRAMEAELDRLGLVAPRPPVPVYAPPWLPSYPGEIPPF